MERVTIDAPDIKLERRDSDDDNELMIDDELEEELVDEMNIENPTEDTNDDQVRLEKLPRPVSELNCRQARTFLVKLLRAANGGMNPHYGNPESRPPFWPDYYWPWDRLFDVHTKPRGMQEPLQYSEMMKLAIGRGYQYFGYDPNTYVRQEGEELNNSGLMDSTSDNLTGNAAEPIVNITEEPFIESDEFDSSKYYLKQPPRLPRGLSKVNCVQARTALAKLLRYQQCGNNPVYGSPDTEPPWWPNNLIRWVDMVDLRGKPPYLPDTKSYTDVLKIAIANSYAYYGYDSENYLDIFTDPNAGLLGEKQKMFPVIPAAGIAPPPAPKTQNPGPITQKQPSLIDQVPQKIQNIMASGSGSSSTDPYAGAKMTELNGDDIIDEDDEEMGELPPKLPMPVGKMNCSVTRTCLAKLIRFHCGRGQLPNYGNPASMPVWWPNHIIDWTKIKNLSHRYEGYLGNTYSNCLRIAMIRGYAHYGLDANEYVERKGIRDPYQPLYSNSPLHLEAMALNNGNGSTSNMPVISNSIQPIPQENRQNLSNSNNQTNIVNGLQIPRRPLPMLVPLSSLVSEGQYPQSLLDTRDWFPPRLAYSKAIDASPQSIKSLKPCKVIVDSSRAANFNLFSLGLVKEDQRINDMLQFFHEDLTQQNFTDIKLVANKKSPKHPRENFSVKVHRFVLAAHSVNLRRMMQDLSDEDPCLVLSGVTGATLRLLVEALYTGKVILDGKAELRKFEAALTCLNSFGILLNLRPVVLNTDYDYGELQEKEEPIEAPPEETFEVTEKDMIEVDMESLLAEDDLVIDQDQAQTSPNLSEQDSTPAPSRKRGRPSKADIVDKKGLSKAELAESLLEEDDLHLNESPTKKGLDFMIELDPASSSTPTPTLTPTRGKRGRPSSSKVELAKDEKASKVEISEKMDLTDQDIDELLADEDSPSKSPEVLPEQDQTEPSSSTTPPTQPKKRGRPSKAKAKAEVSEKKAKELETKKESEEKEGITIEKSPAAAEKNAGAKKRSRHETPEIKSEDESPKRRRRVVDKVNAKAEAKKPNFDNVTVEKLNEKVAEGQRPFIEWLQSEGFLRQTTHCSVKDCQSKMELEQDKDDLDGCVWKCTKCTKKDQHQTVSVRDGSIFGRVKKSSTTGKSDSLSWIIQIILCWSDNTSLLQCQQLTGADVDKIFFWYDECRDYYGTL